MKMRFKFLIILSLILNVKISSQTLTINKILPLNFNADDLSVNENKNYIFLISAETNEITKIDLSGKVQKVIGGFGWGDSQFDFPSSIASTAIDIYISDFNNHRIQRFDHNLNFISSLGENENIKFEFPLSIALSTKGDLYILDSKNRRILKINGFNRLERIFGNYETGKSILSEPKKIKINPSQILFVLDGSKIHLFDQFGNFLKTIDLTNLIEDDIVDFFPENEYIYLITKKDIYKLSDELDKLSFFLDGDINFIFKSIEIKQGEIFLLSTGRIIICKEGK